MKKQMQHHAQKVGLSLVLGLATLVIDGGQMRPAEAGIQVRARVQTPQVTVEYRHDAHPARIQRQRVTRLPLYPVTRQDRAVARRIARATGHGKGDLLQLRMRGLTWVQIGQRLRIPRQVVQDAVHTGPRAAFRHQVRSARRR